MTGVLVLNHAAIAAHLTALADSYEIFTTLQEIPADLRPGVEAVVVGRGGDIPDDQILDALPGLKVVGIVGASVRRYNAESIIGRGIPIINTADVYADAVAEFVVMQAVLAIRKAGLSHEAMRKGGWSMDGKGDDYGFRAKLRRNILFRGIRKALRILAGTQNMPQPGSPARGSDRLLSGSTVALIGYGAITRRTIELLKPFNCEVGVYSENLPAEEAGRFGVRVLSWDEALRCDVISLHRGLSDKTVGCFGREEIMSLKPGTVLINTARAELFDNEALAERLSRGDIFACLDVFAPEPLPRGSLLRKMPNVFLTGHISGSSEYVYDESARKLASKVSDFLSGTEVAYVIDTHDFLQNMT